MLQRILAVLLFGFGSIASVAAALMIFTEKTPLTVLLMALFLCAAFGLISAARTLWRRGGQST